MLSKQELDNNHKACLKLLDTFLTICNENNIVYFLSEGSAIGTVREKGFIPWDTNIDIDLPIDQYEKLDSVMMNLDLGELEWSLQPANSGRLIKRLVYKEKQRIGVMPNLDIGVHAGAPSNFIFRHFDRIILLLNYKAYKLKKSSIKRKFPYNALKLVADIIPDFLFIGTWNFLAHMFTLDNAQYIVNTTPGSGKKGHVFKKEWYLGEPCYGEFEGRKVRIPSNYDAYLSGLYGDYMTPVEWKKGNYHNAAEK